MRTDDTLSRCALASIRLDAEPLVVVAVGLEVVLRSELSRVPLTSTRWPTWFFRSLSRPSSTYETSVRPVAPGVVVPVVPVVVAADVVPAVVLDDPLPIIAFVRMN